MTTAACPSCAAETVRLFRPGDPTRRAQVTNPEDAAALVLPRLAGKDREHCLLVGLDVKHRLLGVTTVSVGTADHTFMAPTSTWPGMP